MKRIVRGNDFTMRIPVVKIVEGEKVAFPLPGCTDIVVRLCSAYRRLELAHTIDAKEDNVIVARVEGDRIPLGTYALEVRGKIFGNDWRSNEYEQVAIVDRNADADTELGETDEGENSVEMDTAVVVLPPDRELEALVKEAQASVESITGAVDKAESAVTNAEKAVREAENVDIDLNGGDLEITRKSGEKKGFDLMQLRGEQGPQGEKGEKGEKGNAFTYADFTQEQIAALQKPAKDVASEVEAAEEKRVENEAARQEAEKKREASEVTRTRTETERETNEQARQASETTRQTAEEKREGDTATAIATMKSDTSAAVKTMQDAIDSLNKYMDIVKLPVVETLATNVVVAMRANKVYRFTLGNNLELSLSAPNDKTVTNEYQGSFDTGDVAPAVTWPEGVVWDATPNIGTNSHVEFNIRYTGGKFFGVALAWDLPTK